MSRAPILGPEMDVIATEIPEVKLLRPARFGDERGFFSETFRAEWFPGTSFVQDNHSLSAAAGTVRGLHFQIGDAAQVKLVRVPRGSVLDVAVDLRSGSPTFGRAVSRTLSAESWEQLWIPVGFAHGFCTLEPDTEVLYKVSAYDSPELERGLAWDDPALGIEWPGFAGAVLSERDAGWPGLADLPEYFPGAGTS